jgi:phospholipase/lecithinase/hemolysin
MINKFSLGLADSPQFTSGSWADAEAPAPAPAATHFSALYAFGDSLSDVGNDYEATDGLIPTSAIYSDGRFSNGDVWVQDLASQLKLGTVKASLDGGQDFAYGGAETGGEKLHQVNPIDLPGQLAQFVLDDPHPEANALYTLSIGANDVIDAISEYARDPAAAKTDVRDAVNNETAFVSDLAALGAKNFVILDIPDLGKTPEEAGHATTATKLSILYNDELETSLKALVAKDHLSIHLVDVFKLIDAAVADPSKYGLSNVTTPVWTGNYYDPFSGTLNATGSAQNKYLFFDSLHPTAAGHLAVADLAHAALGVIV